MNGFRLILQDCCQYCKDFEPKLIQMNITTVSDKNEKYLNNITCENLDKCVTVCTTDENGTQVKMTRRTDELK